MLGCKTTSSHFKGLKSQQSMFSDHSGMKLELKKHKKFEKFTAMRKLNSTFLNINN